MTISESAAPPRSQTFADATEILRKAKPGYEERPQQSTMARAIESIIAKDQAGPEDTAPYMPPALAVQAGTGTGKSFGLLIPAAQSGLRTVISTGTNALLAQLVDEDLPFLAEHLPNFPSYAKLMGRHNYACLAKIEENPPVEGLDQIRTDLQDPEAEGVRESLSVEVGAETWRLISSTSAECPGAKECPFGDRCLAEKAKAKAHAAKLVVTNHAMLGTDMVLRESMEADAGPMLGEYHLLVCDEADALDNAMRGVLTERLAQRGLMALAAGAETFLRQLDEVDGEYLAESVALTQAAQAFGTVLPRVFDKTKGADQIPEGGTLNMSWICDHPDEVVALVNALDMIASRLRRATTETPKEKTRKQMLTAQATNAANALRAAVAAEDSEMARWCTWDRHPNTGELFYTCEFAQVDISTRLRDSLWGYQTTILTSATLTTAPNDFSYFTRILGLEHASTLDVGTPFDYKNQALMFIPPVDAPAPVGDQRVNWLAYSIAKTFELVNYAGGGALLLYTSRDAMTKAHASLAPRLAAKGITVLVQDGETPNAELSRRFREDENSVLFALKSFWVGLNVSGRACRLVVIDKLPFGVPTDALLQARQAAEERAGRSSFKHLTLPMMILELVQGVGRLIRTGTDRGVVAVLDSRLSFTKTGWHMRVLRALPSFDVTEDESDIRDFFAAL